MPPRCNKCKQGLAQEGDTWCLGCSSLEHSLGLLRQGWRNQGLRAVAEEALPLSGHYRCWTGVACTGGHCQVPRGTPSQFAVTQEGHATSHP